MRYILLTVFLVQLYLTVLGQPQFDEIKLCHSKTNEIKQIAIGGYLVNLKDGKMESLKSSDGVFNYQELDKLMGITISPGINFSLKLMKDGVMYNDGDTSFVISSLSSVNLTQADSLGKVQTVINIGKKSLACVFERNRIRRIFIGTEKKHISIVLNLTTNWDFGIAENKNKDYLSLTYSYEYLDLLNITDANHLVGGRIHYSKKDGEIMKITALSVDKNGNSYTLSKVQKYSSNGFKKGRKNVFGSVICE